MMVLELFVPRGAFSAEQLREPAGRLTMEHEGATYGFCSPGCRRHFADKLAREASR